MTRHDSPPGPRGCPRQDITDPATGLSRLLSERCSTCILRPGDLMHLGPQDTAQFVREALAAGSYVVCHQTLTYGDKVSGIASDTTVADLTILHRYGQA